MSGTKQMPHINYDLSRVYTNIKMYPFLKSGRTDRNFQNLFLLDAKKWIQFCRLFKPGLGKPEKNTSIFGAKTKKIYIFSQLVASCDLKPGDVILIEKPLASGPGDLHKILNSLCIKHTQTWPDSISRPIS
jgi:hypothetical protein